MNQNKYFCHDLAVPIQDMDIWGMLINNKKGVGNDSYEEDRGRERNEWYHDDETTRYRDFFF